MATTRYTLQPRRHWTSGALTCLALFAFGGLILWGLFKAPRSRAPASPELEWGVPRRPLRVACLDLGAWKANPLDAAQVVHGLDPDVVLAHRVPGAFVVPLAESLGMQRSYHPANYARVGGDDTAGGCLVLSKYPLYDAAPLRPDVRRAAAVGVWATAVVDGRRLAIASADGGPNPAGGIVPSLTAAAMLDNRQQAAGNPPLIAAFRAPQVLSAKRQMLENARLIEAAGVDTDDADAAGAAGVAPLIAVAGPWRVAPEAAGRPRALAPGILWVEVGPE
jgi:hypothetical protein